MMAELIKRLQKIGWSAEPYDICWMACSRPGHRRLFGSSYGADVEICLCRVHIEELESTSQTPRGVDYSVAAYPESSSEQFPAEDWWPWRVVATGKIVDFL